MTKVHDPVAIAKFLKAAFEDHSQPQGDNSKNTK